MTQELVVLRKFIKEFEKTTGIEFTCELKINSRLSKALGRCVVMESHDIFTKKVINIRPVSIEISKKFLQVATSEEIKNVLAHEFAHYCTFVVLGNHNHDTKTFKDFCKKLNTTSAPVMVTKNKFANKYDIYCSCCKKHLGSKTTARAGVIKNPGRYKSNCCKTPVEVIQNF